MVEGRPPKPTRRSTIADVAARAGVDRAVVSRLLNADPRLSIRESTRQRVLDAIEELGYQPNAAARSLRTARTRTIALLVPDYINPAYGEIIEGAEAAAAKVGCSLMTASLQAADDSFERYVERLGHGRVDGLLLAAGGVRGTREDELERLGLPWLCVNRTGPGRRRYVVLDDERAAALAVEHLVQLGHRRLAFISGPEDSDSARRRQLGHRSAIKAAGLARGPVVHGNYTPRGGAEAMAKILEAEQRPTAVLVANVASATGALHTARRMGVRVPQDISVIAVHDLTVAPFLDPPLTTVRMALDGLGARAVELLLERAANAEIRETVREPTELVIRESTAPPS
ncbi:LacI family transcriptional regulator [Saccharopolyspora sp. K220]|uniref:LacI family DNA-binding transcriptional regulator n=1 Tax=Saccharopolyspora soli TaxID=2926618 RepID=UPI001F5A1392|nr:LacI family DNA-binding transcriptional regulator [Saccharopolyspora soli]MCI2416789.1 LacI family transcriptional regulator [Saccharopolyspora soli]